MIGITSTTRDEMTQQQESKQSRSDWFKVVLMIASPLAGVFLAAGAVTNELRRVSETVRDLAQSVNGISNRLTAVESSRFTTTDGLRITETVGRINEQLAKTTQALVDMERRITENEHKINAKQ